MFDVEEIDGANALAVDQYYWFVPADSRTLRWVSLKVGSNLAYIHYTDSSRRDRTYRCRYAPVIRRDLNGTMYSLDNNQVGSLFYGSPTNVRGTIAFPRRAAWAGAFTASGPHTQQEECAPDFADDELAHILDATDSVGGKQHEVLPAEDPIAVGETNPPAPQPQLDGQLIRAAVNDRVYLVLDGYRRAIPNQATLERLFRTGRTIRNYDVRTVPENEPISENAQLMRTDTMGMFLVTQDVARHILSPQVMDAYQFRMPSATVPHVMLEAMDNGPDIF